MVSVCQFIDEFIRVDGNGQAFRLEDHQRRILEKAFRYDDQERFIYRTIIYSAPKKSGKTAINALVCLWWAFCIEAPNEIIIAANDLDQSVSRVYDAGKGFITKNSELKERANFSGRLLIRLKNETTLRAIPSDYAGQAGSNQGLVSFDELWGFMSEKSRRLYEELTPVPTRKNSIRFISTYAGWEGESILLEDLYSRIFDKQGNVKPGVKRPLGEDFPVYTIGDLFVYWDHEPRMPWQTPEYYESQRADLRTNSYLRLHENKWVSNESSFFDMEDWDTCVDPEHRPPLPSKGVRLYVGADASVKKDRSAVVSVYRKNDFMYLGPMRVWQPSPKEPIDLEATMETYIKDLKKIHTVIEVRYDPFQFHRSATTLKQAGVKMVEFPQTESNMTNAGQALYDAVKHQTLKLYKDSELRKEACSAVGKETPRGMRIVKEKASQKIDAIIALAMAVHGASSELECIPGSVSLGVSWDRTDDTARENKKLPEGFEWIEKNY
jgi:phage terminase large subunit-like protein